MSVVIRVIKRPEKADTDTSPTGVGPLVQSATSEIVNTVKSWIADSRERRRIDANYAAGLLKRKELSNAARSERLLTLKHKIGATIPCEATTNCLAFFLTVVLVLFVAPDMLWAQALSVQTLTLDQAIDLALQNNHAIKIASFEVAKAEEEISVAKTSRLPLLHTYTLFSGNLAKNDIKIPNPAANQFPGLGPFFLLTQERKPSAVFAVTAVEPLSQQYRIGLNIKLEHLSREMAQAKLRQQQNETIDQVKKTYYAIQQTKSALSSLDQAVKSYKELDKVTSDYVVQQIVLKADHLVVQTRLARAQYDELELSSKLATQKEQLNSLLGREVGYEFEVTDAPAFISVETNLTVARQLALEHRPELQQARLTVQQATLARRIKKSEYIPDVSAGFTYLTPRNFPAVVPREFANVGVVVSWEFFDWGRKKHELAELDNTIEQAKNGLKETEDQVLVDVGDKLRKLQLSGQALRVAKLAEDTAKESLRVSTGQYKFQTVMLSDVLKSQASLAEASNEYQRALLTFWTAKAAYEKALGENK